jgi:hypothetical protein
VPQTRLEWVLFALGAAAIAVLGVLIATTKTRDRGASGVSAATHVITHATTTTARATTTAAYATTTAGPPSPPPPLAAEQTTRADVPEPASPGRVALELTAAGASTWFEVRDGSSTAKLLFTGIVPAGETHSFSGQALWVRFGSASNVEALLNGKPLDLGDGTYSATITGKGLRRSAT